MYWRRMQNPTRIRSSCSSCSRCCVALLWLLIFLAPESRGQRLREAEPEQTKAQLAEKDAICHPDGCFAVFLQKRTFREAGRSCRERGGTLATMHTDEVAGVVHQLLSGIQAQGSRLRLRLWIGLHRPPRQCSTSRPLRGFVWVTGLLFHLHHHSDNLNISVQKNQKKGDFAIFHRSSLARSCKNINIESI